MIFYDDLLNHNGYAVICAQGLSQLKGVAERWLSLKGSEGLC